MGAEVCAACHAKEAAKQPSTPMGRASQHAADCELLKARPRMTFRNGRYTYEIRREGASGVYAVGDGVSNISEPLLFCFGEGAAGQTYIFRHRGAYYESRVSYFREPNRLDITIEHPRAEPASLEDALGRLMSEEEARGCFGCHTTDAAGAAGLRPERAAPGVSCEACHGPGERHLAAVKAKDSKNLQIYNPAGLDGLELSQKFCGACHDPHGPLERDPVKYDANCLSCHVSTPKEPGTRAPRRGLPRRHEGVRDLPRAEGRAAPDAL